MSLPTYTELAAKLAQFFTASDISHAIVNGPATGVGSTVTVTSGNIDTHAKQELTFETSRLAFVAAGEEAIENFEDAGLALILSALNIPIYANLTAANAALAIGKIYYDTALTSLNVTTA